MSLNALAKHITLLGVQNDTSKVQKLVDLDSVSITGVVNKYSDCTLELDKPALYSALTSDSSKLLLVQLIFLSIRGKMPKPS